LTNRWGRRRASTWVAMSLVLAQAGCSGSSGQPANRGATSTLAPTDYRLSVQVVDAAGERHATARCTGEIHGTGYLADLTPAFAACATAMADPQVALFLGRGEVPVLEPGCDSESASADLRDAQAAIRVDSEAEHLERRLTVTDRCTELQWLDMSPLLQPESAPKVDPE
jgi:hypothetical protein